MSRVLLYKLLPDQDTPGLRWDVGQPIFVRDVWRALLGLWLVSSGISAVAYRGGFGGLLSGGLLGIALLWTAILAGNAFLQYKPYKRIILGLMSKQLLIWVAMALLLIVVKVHPVAFVLGASLLPLSIVLTLAWYSLNSRKKPM